MKPFCNHEIRNPNASNQVKLSERESWFDNNQTKGANQWNACILTHSAPLLHSQINKYFGYIHGIGICGLSSCQCWNGIINQIRALFKQNSNVFCLHRIIPSTQFETYHKVPMNYISAIIGTIHWIQYPIRLNNR